MPELSYPISCRSCGKQLYGPTLYCPYCAAPHIVAPTVAPAATTETIIQEIADNVVIPRNESIAIQQPVSKQDEIPVAVSSPGKTHKQEQISEPITEKIVITANDDSAQPVVHPAKSSSKLRWIVVTAMVAGIAGYFYSHQKSTTSVAPSAPVTSISKPKKLSRKVGPSKSEQQSPQISLTPSFDCRKASTSSERLICSNDELCKADVQLAKLYRAARKSAIDKESLKKEQISWLKNQRDVCLDLESMLQVYKDRIAQVSNY